MRTLEIYGKPIKHYSGMLMVGDKYLTAAKTLTSSPVYAMKTNLSSQNLRRTIQNDPRITGVLFSPYYQWRNPRACHWAVEKK